MPFGHQYITVKNDSRVAVHVLVGPNPDWTYADLGTNIVGTLLLNLVPVVGEVKDAETLAQIYQIFKGVKMGEMAAAGAKALNVIFESATVIKQLAAGASAVEVVDKTLSSLGYVKLAPGEEKNVWEERLSRHPWEWMNPSTWAEQFGAETHYITFLSPTCEFVYEYEQMTAHVDEVAAYVEATISGATLAEDGHIAAKPAAAIDPQLMLAMVGAGAPEPAPPSTRPPRARGNNPITRMFYRWRATRGHVTRPEAWTVTQSQARSASGTAMEFDNVVSNERRQRPQTMTQLRNAINDQIIRDWERRVPNPPLPNRPHVTVEQLRVGITNALVDYYQETREPYAPITPEQSAAFRARVLEEAANARTGSPTVVQLFLEGLAVAPRVILMLD